MTPYEALYGRPRRSPICWTKVGERSITGLDLIRDTSEKVDLIRKRLFMTQSRQKSYADRRLLTNSCIEIKFMLLLPKDYYLIPSKGTKNLLTKIELVCS